MLSDCGNKKISEELNIIHRQISLLLMEQINIKNKFVKQKFFYSAYKPGKMLAYKLREEQRKKLILKIKYHGTIFSNQKDIEKSFVNFYTNLFRKDSTTEDIIKKYLDNKSIRKIVPEHSEILNREITIHEIQTAILTSKTGKAAGPDSFPAQYYRSFSENLITPLQLVMNNILKGEIPRTWLESNTTLIPKIEDTILEPKNFRQIALLNVDYKIVTNILANRLKIVLKEYIQWYPGIRMRRVTNFSGYEKIP